MDDELEDFLIPIDNIDFIELILFTVHYNFEAVFVLQLTEETKDKYVHDMLENIFNENIPKIKIEDSYAHDITGEQIYDALTPYIEIIDDVKMINDKYLSEVCKSLTLSIFQKEIDILIEKGIVNLCWDKDKNDFIYKINDKK